MNKQTKAKEFVEDSVRTTDLNAAIARLASMPDVLYATIKRDEAKRLNMSVADLDRLVRQKRNHSKKQQTDVAPLHSHWTVKPWPEPVDGDALLRDLIARARRHVVYSDALITALWVIFSWVHEDVAVHSPLLLITSAEPECGKSTLLSLISYLAPRAIASVEISKAALYRSIQLWKPSFIIDEFDDVLSASSKDESKAELRSVINSGHTRGQGVVRCITDEHRPELLSTFCPKAIGMVGRKLPASTLSRSIIIELRRRTKDENIEEFAFRDDGELGDLRRRLCRWAKDHADALRGADVAMPEAFYNRRGNNWRLLFAIADLCSGAEDWGERARAAAIKLEGAFDTNTIGVVLLIHIRRIFDEDQRDYILSGRLVERLKEDPEAPWTEWSRGKGLSQKGLADLLGRFHIFPADIRPHEQGRGYRRAQFEEAWQRYLPQGVV